MCDGHQPGLSRRSLLRGGAALAVTAPLLGAVPAMASTGHQRPKVLVFSKTDGFRHASIEVGIETVWELGDEYGFGVDATEDAAEFTRANLRRFAAVIFLNTTGTVLGTAGQKSAFERYVRGGGGFVGAYFRSHPVQQVGFFDNEAPDHPATKHLDARFGTFDEFYSFGHNPRPDVRVLLSIDESTYLPDPNTTNIPCGSDCGPESPADCAPKPIGEWVPGETGYMSGQRGVPGDHPMSWCHDKFRGRAFYTALGHESYLYGQDWYRQHLAYGILTATRQVDADCGLRSPVDARTCRCAGTY